MLAKTETLDFANNVKRIVYASPAALRAHFNEDIGLRTILRAYCGIGHHRQDWMPAGFSAAMALEACTMGCRTTWKPSCARKRELSVWMCR